MMLEPAWQLCRLEAGWALEGQAACGAEEEEETRCSPCNAVRESVLLRLHSGPKECVALYPELPVYYKALIFRFAFTPLFKSDFYPEPAAQDTSSYLASLFGVVLLMGQNRTSIYLFPVRPFCKMTVFLQLPSRSNWEQYWKNSNWISLRNKVPCFQRLNVVSGFLEF